MIKPIVPDNAIVPDVPSLILTILARNSPTGIATGINSTRDYAAVCGRVRTIGGNGGRSAQAKSPGFAGAYAVLCGTMRLYAPERSRTSTPFGY